MTRQGSSQQNNFTFLIKVIPRSPYNKFIGYRGNEAVIKIKAPPESGKANRELIDFLATQLAIPKNYITLLRGLTSRHKTILLPASMKEKCHSVFPAGSV